MPEKPGKTTVCIKSNAFFRGNKHFQVMPKGL
jgi:hypothetical protein